MFRRDWQPALSGLPYTLLILLPRLDEVLRRAAAAARSKRVREDIIHQQHAASQEWDRDFVLDTTTLSVDEALALALSMHLLP